MQMFVYNLDIVGISIINADTSINNKNNYAMMMFVAVLRYSHHNSRSPKISNILKIFKIAKKKIDSLFDDVIIIWDDVTEIII